MNARLLYEERDFDPAPQALDAALTQDLELETLFAAMAAGDAYILDVARRVVLTSLDEPEAIRRRQQILADCFERGSVVREMCAIAVEAIERERKIWGWTSEQYAQGVLHRSVQVLELFIGLLRKLRRLADENAGEFRSGGFATLFSMLSRELNDEYLDVVTDHLRRLQFQDGILVSCGLGEANKGARYILRRTDDAYRTWPERLWSWVKRQFIRDRSGYTYRVADRDEIGHRALDELRNRGVAVAAAALARSMDHILSFFKGLRLELAFYVGCLNLRDRLTAKGEPTCFPEPLDSGKVIFSSRGLYDPCLCLSMEGRVAGNDICACGKSLVMVTGANRGGKSTFLRSIGLAQLMMQAGMFVPANALSANVCHGVFTHFKREEDAGMKSGKLDEELSRMSAVIDHIRSGSIVLLNESFASTNEREGSEIARQIVRALLEKGVKVFYVTHLFDLAHGFHLANMESALFLRAERLADGRRTFRLVEGEPLPTSYGEDLYRRIFGEPENATSFNEGM